MLRKKSFRVLLTCVSSVALIVVLIAVHIRQTAMSRQCVLVDSVFDICPDLYLRVVATRANIDQDASNSDVIYVNLSREIDIICGKDPSSADSYAKREFVLKNISQIRKLAKEDIAELLAYLRAPDYAMFFMCVAALKDDVMKLLRNQEPSVEGLADTLMEMYNGGEHLPAILNHCIQHLGAMVNELDDATRIRAREVLIKATLDTSSAYAGTALYSLAEDRRATPTQNAELKQLTLALCASDASDAARIAASQLSGQLGYGEALPALRATLSCTGHNAVLDTVTIGSIGLLGNEDDIALLESLGGNIGRAAAVEAAIKQIKERVGMVKLDPSI